MKHVRILRGILYRAGAALAILAVGCGPAGDDGGASGETTSGSDTTGTGSGVCFDGLPTPGTLCVPAWAEYTEDEGLVLDLAAGDLDGDGGQDLVVVVGGYGATFRGIRWYRNNGFGGLEEPMSLPFEGAGDFAGLFVALADADADGDLDVFADGAGTVRWFENDGAGGLDAGPPLFDGEDPVCVDAVAGDFDGDGHEDVALSCATPENTLDLRVVWGGVGSFDVDAPLGVVSGTNQLPAFGMAAGDVDGDGLSDVLVVDQGTGEVYVVRGTSDRELALASTVDIGPDRQAIATADLDADGDSDFVVVDRATGTYATFLGDTAGILVGGPTGEIVPPMLGGPGGEPLVVPVLGDWDGDGRFDLMAGGLDEFPAVVFDLMEPARWPRATPALPFAEFGLAVDLDGDGFDDVVAVDRGTPVAIHLGIVQP